MTTVLLPQDHLSSSCSLLVASAVTPRTPGGDAPRKPDIVNFDGCSTAVATTGPAVKCKLEQLLHQDLLRLLQVAGKSRGVAAHASMTGLVRPTVRIVVLCSMPAALAVAVLVIRNYLLQVVQHNGRTRGRAALSVRANMRVSCSNLAAASGKQ